MRKHGGLVAILVGVLVSGVSWAAPAPKLEFLTRDGCVTTDRMRTNLEAALRILDRPIDYAVTDADSLNAADTKRGYGTPTVLVGGRDLFGMPEPAPSEDSPT